MHSRHEMKAVIKNIQKVYIGNIPRDAREHSIERLFSGCGKTISFEFKGDFAFVEYFDPECAQRAIREYDGHRLRGRQLIVEPFRYRGGDPRYRREQKDNKRGQYRVIVTNVSHRTTSHDLKDWMQSEKINGVTMTDVYNRHGLNEGVIEFNDRQSFEYVLRQLNGMRVCGTSVRLHDERDHNRQKLLAFGGAVRGGRGGGNDRERRRGGSKGGYTNHKRGYSPNPERRDRRDRDWGRERDRDRDQDWKNGSSRDRGRDRDRDDDRYRNRRDSPQRDRGFDRGRYRERYTEKDDRVRDRAQYRSRSRSRSRSRRRDVRGRSRS